MLYRPHREVDVHHEQGPSTFSGRTEPFAPEGIPADRRRRPTQAAEINATRSRVLVLCVLAFFLGLLSSPSSSAAEERPMSLSESISKTLEINAGVQIQKEMVEQQAGAVQRARGEFDWSVFGELSAEDRETALAETDQVLWPTGQIIDESEETTVVYSVGASRKFRNGVVMSPSVSSTDYRNNIDRLEPTSQAELSMEMIIPLMRGAGEASVTANERSEQSKLEAARLQSAHDISNLIFQTARSYWNCLASRKRSQILFDSQGRADHIFQQVQLLVKAGELEPVLLRQAKAELHTRRADLIEGERAFRASRLSLSAAIGFPPEKTGEPPTVVGRFPTAVNDGLFSEAAADDYVRRSLERRGDYLAALKQVFSEKALLEKALNQTRPRVDLTFQAGYSGLDEDSETERRS